MTEFSVSVRGTGITCSILKPDGSTFDLISRSVTNTALSDGHFITIKTPVSGTWTVNVVGAAAFSLDVIGVTSLHLSSFNFVAITGRPGHEGYFPISGQPAYDHAVAAIGVLDGTFSSAKFDLRSPTGAVLVDSGMAPGSGAEGDPPSNSFYGEMTLVPGTLYAYCSGVDGAGAPFQRVFASVFTPILSNTTLTGFNNSNPFAVLANTTNMTTTSSSTTTITSTTSTKTSSWSYTKSRTSVGYSWTPPPYATSSWRNSHTCKPGVVYTHSAYDWNDSEITTKLTITKTSDGKTLTLTTTSVILCSTCDSANYPSSTWASWMPAKTSHSGSAKLTATKTSEYSEWQASQTKASGTTWSWPTADVTPDSSPDHSIPDGSAPWSAAATSASNSQPSWASWDGSAPSSSLNVYGSADSASWSATAATSSLVSESPYVPQSPTAVAGESSAALSGTVTQPATALWTGGAERNYGRTSFVLILGAVFIGLVMV